MRWKIFSYCDEEENTNNQLTLICCDLQSLYITMIKSIWIAFFAFLCLTSAYSQDVHFSQAFTVGQYLNPAMAGNFEGRYRINTVYRDQGRGILGQPLVSYGFGGDVKFDISPRDINNGDFFGAGVFFFTDQSPTFELNTNSIALNLSYHKKLGRQSSDYLSAGFLIGVQQRNINYDNLDFGDEFNQIDAFDQSTGEVLPPNNFGYADVGIGLTYSTQPSKDLKLFLGSSLHHFNTPSLSFFKQLEIIDPNIQTDFELYSKLNVHASVNYAMSDFTWLLPRIIYVKQGPHQQLNLGTYLKFEFIQTNTALYTGLWARMVDNVDGFGLRYLVPNVGFEIGNFLMGISYDLNMLNTFTDRSGANTLELTIRFLGSFENNDYFCPQF